MIKVIKAFFVLVPKGYLFTYEKLAEILKDAKIAEVTANNMGAPGFPGGMNGAPPHPHYYVPYPVAYAPPRHPNAAPAVPLQSGPYGVRPIHPTGGAGAPPQQYGPHRAQIHGAAPPVGAHGMAMARAAAAAPYPPPQQRRQQ